MQQYWESIQTGDLATLSSLLRVEPSLLDARNLQGAHGIQVATYFHQLGARQVLADRSKSVDLPCACCLGNTARIKRLLRDGIDPNQLSPDGFRPLGLAAAFGGVGAAIALLDAGADIEGVSVALPVRPIHAAVFGRNHDVVELLLSRGADPNAAQDGGFTALHAATQSKMAATVSLLLAHGANPDAQTSEGKTARDFE